MSVQVTVPITRARSYKRTAVYVRRHGELVRVVDIHPVAGSKVVWLTLEDGHTVTVDRHGELIRLRGQVAS